jgi:hypothetical protein
VPALGGEPEGVAAGSACEIESAAGSEIAHTSGEERRDTLVPRLGAVLCAISFIPARQIHASSLKGKR